MAQPKGEVQAPLRSSSFSLAGGIWVGILSAAPSPAHPHPPGPLPTSGSRVAMASSPPGTTAKVFSLASEKGLGAAVSRYLCIPHQRLLHGGSCGFPRPWPGTERWQPRSPHSSLHPTRWALSPAQRWLQLELTELGHSQPPGTPPGHPPVPSGHRRRCPTGPGGEPQLCQSSSWSHSPAWCGPNLELLPLQTPPAVAANGQGLCWAPRGAEQQSLLSSQARWCP